MTLTDKYQQQMQRTIPRKLVKEQLFADFGKNSVFQLGNFLCSIFGYSLPVSCSDILCLLDGTILTPTAICKEFLKVNSNHSEMPISGENP